METGAFRVSKQFPWKNIVRGRAWRARRANSPSENFSFEIISPSRYVVTPHSLRVAGGRLSREAVEEKKNCESLWRGLELRDWIIIAFHSTPGNFDKKKNMRGVAFLFFLAVYFSGILVITGW